MNPPHQDPIVSLERIVSLLSGIPSFEILDPTLLQKIALLLGVEQHPEGTEIIHEDRFGDRLYLIESGVVGVYTGGPTGPLLLGKLGEGDRFGDVDLLTSTRRRRASVTALTPVTLLTLGADHYESLIRKYPSLKGDLACAAAEFMQKRLDALMQAQMAKISGLQHGETLF